MPYMTFAKTVASWALRKPSTRKYPFEKRPAFEGARGHIEIDIGACIFCSLCQRRCPSDAIGVDKGAKQWAINRLRCIQCSACVEACPKKCLTMANTYSPAVVEKGVDTFRQEPKPSPSPEAQNQPPAAA